MKQGLAAAFILVVILSIFQTSTVYGHLPGGLRPDMVGMLVLAVGAIWGSRWGGLLGFIGGLLVGLPLLHFWGFWVLIYCGLGMLSGLVSKRFYIEHPLALGLLGLLGGILLGFLPPFLAYIFEKADYPRLVLSDFTFSLGAGLLLLFILYYFLSIIQNRFEHQGRVRRS